MDITLSVTRLIFEMLKIPKAKVEAHFLKKLPFLNNKSLVQYVFGKYPRTTKNLSKYTRVRETILVGELHRRNLQYLAVII